MPAHRFRTQLTNASPGSTLTIRGSEAQHAAKVKRLRPGESAELLDGFGSVASATIQETDPRAGSVTLLITALRREPQTKPRLNVMTAVPKGSHLEEMIAALSQAGASAWQPITTEYGNPAPKPDKADRLARIADESAKQCGRAWLLELARPAPFEQALARPNPILADASGEPYTPSAQDEITLLIGPEGGWSDAELNLARSRGVRVASFGCHVMRIEVAAVAAAAIIIHMETLATRSRPQGEPS